LHYRYTLSPLLYCVWSMTSV